MIVQYDTQKYDFRAWASSVLRVESLEKTHERKDLKLYTDVIKRINICRDELFHDFEACRLIYIDFIRSVIIPIYDGIIVYQMPPTFRFHYSMNGSSGFHRDRDYGQKSSFLNVWLPLTRVWGTNSLWVESEEEKGDFTPVELEYGELLIFDGANLCHGSRWNLTESTRVSFDFRFEPVNSIEPPTNNNLLKFSFKG